MFEDSTFESAGRIHTRSRSWMMAAFTFNTSILVAMILIPLIRPAALPHYFIAFLMDAPLMPVTQPPQKPAEPVARPASEMPNGVIVAPRRINPEIYIALKPEPPVPFNSTPWDQNAVANPNMIGGPARMTVVRQERNTPLRVSTTVEDGLLILKRVPVYPAIARAAGISGTVVLAATISKTGTIENLRVTSGPAILQQAALDAVSTWRYRPYLLDGQPVEVETTVNVIFTLGR
jgi:protein TonB